MKSLVVLLSVAALAAAKPSALLSGGVISAPLVAAAPVAVSRQSRMDIRSSPPLVFNAPFTPLVAQPVLNAPAAAAVSTVSRIDINETPVVTSPLVSAAPLRYGAIGAIGVVKNSVLGYNTLLGSKPGMRYDVPVLVNTLGNGIANSGILTSGFSYV